MKHVLFQYGLTSSNKLSDFYQPFFAQILITFLNEIKAFCVITKPIKEQPFTDLQRKLPILEFYNTDTQTAQMQH